MEAEWYALCAVLRVTLMVRAILKFALRSSIPPTRAFEDNAAVQNQKLALADFGPHFAIALGAMHAHAPCLRKSVSWRLGFIISFIQRDRAHGR
jgi:hypothetical protein